MYSCVVWMHNCVDSYLNFVYGGNDVLSIAFEVFDSSHVGPSVPVTNEITVLNAGPL